MTTFKNSEIASTTFFGALGAPEHFPAIPLLVFFRLLSSLPLRLGGGMAEKRVGPSPSFIFSGFAECLEEFACFCQDSTNVLAMSLLPRCDFAAISQDSMNVSANLPTSHFSTNV